MDNSATPHDRVLAQRNAGGWMFLMEAVKNLRTTGAVAPSSRRLAHLLTDPVREQAGRPLSILEAGAGTGSVTRTLIPLLGAGSRLDIVEANPRFASRLRRLTAAQFRQGLAARQISVHHTLVERYQTDHRYDVIVSGLPFTNFTPGDVETIMDRYMDLLHPGGTLTYFSYLATGTARRMLASRAEAARHRAVEHVLAGYRHRFTIGRWTVWGNLPPAHVWQLRAPQSPSLPSPALARPEVSR